MMAFITPLRQINKNLLQLFPPILKRSPLTKQRIINPHLQLLYHPPKPQVENVLNVRILVINCPTKRTMMVKGGQVVSEHSDNSSRSNSLFPSNSLSDNDCEIPCEGDILMIRRMLGTIPKPLDDNQRENICHTRYLITNKLCSLIIDWGSCTNVASTRVEDKLALPIISHTKPYKLQWLSDEGEIMVNKQVFINFSIGKYKDEVLYDVVPMEATRVLLGRPWQYDRHVLHDGLSNTMFFSFQGCKVTLTPFSPREVHEDQIKIKTKRENEKAKEVSTKPSHNTLSTKSIMLTRVMPQLEPQRYSSSLSFSLPKVPNSTPSWLKNVRDDFYIPPNGFHLLRGFFSKEYHHS